MLNDAVMKDVIHRWKTLSFLLMQMNVGEGEAQLSLYLHGISRYKLGWNAITQNGSKRYTLIERNPPWYTTKRKPPVPDSEIYQVNATFTFHNSEAEKQLLSICNYVSELCKKENNDGPFLETMKTLDADRLKIIRAASLTENEIDDEIKNLFTPLLKELTELVSSELRTFDPAIDLAHSIIEKYLNLEISGEITVEVIAYFVIAFCQIIAQEFIKDKNKRKIIEFQLFKNAIEYLGVVNDLLLREERTKYNLSSFYKITYLAVLYGKVATTIIEYLQRNNPSEENDESWATMKYRGIDEVNVHLGYSTFVYPALLKPYSDATYLESANLVKSKKLEFVYPQIKKDKIPYHDFEKVFSSVEAISLTKPEIEVKSFLNSKRYPIISPKIMFDLALFDSLYHS